MAQTNKPDLLLCIAGPEDRTRKWVLDPPHGVDSFRIVVRCRRAQGRPSPKPCSWFGHLWRQWAPHTQRQAMKRASPWRRTPETLHFLSIGSFRLEPRVMRRPFLPSTHSIGMNWTNVSQALSI